MIFELSKLEKTAHPNFKGGEGVFSANISSDGTNKVIMGELEPGCTIGYHKHEGDCEYVFILEGRAKILMDDGVEYAEAGELHYCPEGHSHSVQNGGDTTLKFIGIVPKQ